jgi:signal transduction histidine kinase/ActR/RegA family two-component response regulator
VIHRLQQGSRWQAWHLSTIGLIVGLLWAGIGFNLWHDYRAAVDDAAKDTANLARTFDEDITRTVESVDQTLLFTREAYRHDPTGLLLGSWAKTHAFLDNLHMRISLVDRAGDVVWSNLGPVPIGTNVADRAHFQSQKASHDDALMISGPVLGRVSGKWTIQFIRKLQAPDGSFDGIATVSLDRAYLSRFYQSISIGKGSILLATAEGTVLARAPEHQPVTGRELPPETLGRLLRGASSGAFWTVSSIDHVERIFSARRVERYPLVVSVGLATQDVFAAYDRTLRLYVGAGILLSATCVIVGLVMARQRQSLVDSRQALSVTLENMSEGIVMVRADGSIPVISHRAIQLLELPFGLLADRPTYQQIIDWQHARHEFGDPETWAPEMERAVRGADRQHGDYTYERTRPNGRVLEVRTLGLPDGGIVRTFTDISDRKRNEMALAAAQSRAAHAERMQALGQLAGGIAHDFNNILQSVQGGATLIDKRAADPNSVRRFAQMILDATARGTAITHRLLAFARRGELRAEPVEPQDLLSGLRDVLTHTLGSGITIEVQVAAGLPPLLADKGQLETVLVNLATNARDAMPNGGPLTLAAAAEVVEEAAGEEAANHRADLHPGHYIRLSVADTGTGIDAAILVRVLEPFFTTKPAGKGTGLGLSMAKGFAEQSGGGLAIDSRFGRGTTIHLWLPAAIRLDEPSGPAGPSGAVRDGSLRRILLVDDEAMVRETMAASLEDAGYAVMIAADGSEALELLRSAAMVDVLVTDLSMPGLDGLALIRQAQGQRAGLPAVLLTGYAGHSAELAVGGMVSGAFSLVRKPVTAAQLADRIEALLAVAVADGPICPA